MPASLYDPRVDALLRSPPRPPFPSPADWRDHWIYFLLVDRFDNPAGPPRFPDPCNVYQGGSFAGIRRRLPYLKELGVGALWLSPVLMNPPWFRDYWGGYGIMDFLRVEPRFCSDPDRAAEDPSMAENELRQLVDEAHAHGICVIFDIVLNHVGDLFNYEGMRDSAPWNPWGEYSIYWRDKGGSARGDWTEIGAISDLPRKAGIWPREFQRNDYFRRRGSHDEHGDITRGDFDRLKELVTEYLIPQSSFYPLRNLLIRSHQYLIAKYDVDGFRIDTLQYVESDFARVFGNAMREYALSIGKKNFFTFGEVWKDDDEIKIAEFVGRNTEKNHEMIGVDAAIDFPVRRRLVDICKACRPPADLAHHLNARREVLKRIVSSHGDAGGHYITFLDNHDMNERFHYSPLADQTRLALSCLMTLQGIPCIYYGTEQGLDGQGDRREHVREALWGRSNAFSQDHDLYRLIRQLSDLRNQLPPLRYGRQYFRPCSGNGFDFGYSPFMGGVLAYSRVLNDREVLVAANTSVDKAATVHVIVDHHLNPENRPWKMIFSTQGRSATYTTRTSGSLRTVRVDLNPMEAQILA